MQQSMSPTVEELWMEVRVYLPDATQLMPENNLYIPRSEKDRAKVRAIELLSSFANE